MTRPTLRPRAALAARAVVAVVLGVVVFLGVASLSPDQRQEDLAATLADPLSALQSDRIEATLADLADDGVSVSDDGRTLLDEDGERAVEEAVRRAEDIGLGPVYVVVWADRQELGATESDVVEVMADRLVAAPGVDRGFLLVWQGPEQGYVEALGSRYRSTARYIDSYRDFVGDPAVTLPKIVDELGAAEYDDLGPEVEARITERADQRAGAMPGSGAGWVGSVLVGALLGLGTLLAVWVARAWLRSRSAPAPGAWRPRGVDR